jgi:hypothetical protein
LLVIEIINYETRISKILQQCRTYNNSCLSLHLSALMGGSWSKAILGIKGYVSTTMGLSVEKGEEERGECRAQEEFPRRRSLTGAI